ncbi:EexN family lipoprotein [Enterobacter mori]|uniref:EexN family lipoprotein n=1 Tax=Enterobacter mori TaxID=539813 RepID=UPI00387E5476
MLKVCIVLTLLLSIVTGCDNSIKSVDYFSRHLSEALHLSEECDNSLWRNDECANAHDALIQAERMSTITN